jgi:hypothetical protein
MNTNRLFQALAFAGLIALHVTYAQAQTRGVLARQTPYGAQAQNSHPRPADAGKGGKGGPSEEPKDPKKATLVGSWLLTVNIPGNAPPFDSFKALWALTKDGLLISSAQGDVAPTPFPTGSSAYGAWEQTGDHQFAATFLSILYDSQTGENMGQFKLQQTITLGDKGDEWSGPFRLTVTDPDGNVVAVVDGSAQASRIKVEPLNIPNGTVPAPAGGGGGAAGGR